MKVPVGRKGHFSAAEVVGCGLVFRTGSDVQQVVSDGQREYRTPVSIKIDGGFVRIHIDEKVYPSRLPSPDRLEALQYTDSRTGLTANFAPRTWFRCS